jgi:AcrR family transcriptional regulator
VKGGTRNLRDKQKEQTREEIVRAAFELFGRHGYDEVPMEKISEAAGVSRATLFNYFPKKELILQHIARARVSRLKEIVARYDLEGKRASFQDVLSLMLAIAEENARIAGGARKLLLKVMFQQATEGNLMAAREEALKVLSGVIERIPGRRPVAARLVAETVFAVFIATMLEWLMREEKTAEWLPRTVRERLELALMGVA